MKPPEDIKKYFKKATLSTNQEKHEAVFEKILSAHEQANKQEPESSRINLGRIIMKSPVSKIAIAAVVIVACAIGLTMLDKTGSVALANVLTQIEKFNAYMYEMNMDVQLTQTINDRTINSDQEMQGTILISQEHGMKMAMDVYNKSNQQNTSQEMYYLFDEKSLLMIMPDQKSYTRMEIDNAQINQARAQNYDPHAMVQQILKCDYDVLDQKTIDGIKVQGFHTNDPKYQGGVLGKADITLWVDIQTKLPVQMVMEYEINSSVQKMSMSGVIDNFQWNVSVDDKEFQPEIPEDYKSLTGNIKIPDYNKEETVIDGLRIFSELTGAYPEDMNPMSLPAEISKVITSDTPAAKKFQNELKELNNEEKSQKLVDVAAKVQGAGMFYTNLSQKDKNTAYYGDRVSPGDSDNVLMRWKISDNDYRVIFGDLKVETLTKETLDQIEKSLPEKKDIEN
ncbi:MAG: hypothetical protein JW787_02455 [Sedimentisphaerales bacterium]|nr:hypothetical protein [Sedimentisphaerales bacterium]